MMFYVEAKARSKSSTGSRSSDRRNVLVFRRSAFSRDADDNDNDDIFDEGLPFSPAPQRRCNDRAVGDLQVDDAAKEDATQSEMPTSAAAVTTTTDGHDRISSSGVLSTCSNSSMHTEPSKCTNSLTKTTVKVNPELAAENDASSLTSVGTEPRPRSLTKGEIPTFYSLNTSPPSAKCSATARRVARDDRKNGTSAAGKFTKSKATSRKKTATSDKSSAVKSVSDDRRLTYVVKETRGAKELLVSEKVQSRSSLEMLEDCCNADVEDIMDQNEEILQDVSGCSELFPIEDSNTLVPSLSNCSSVTLVPDGSCSSVSGIPSNAQHPTAADPGGPSEKAVAYNVNTKPVGTPTELQAGDITSLVVTDMELTSINTSKSPVVFGSVSDNASSETASNSAKDLQRESEQTVIYCVDNRNNEEPVRDMDDARAFSTCTRSKSRKTITVAKPAKASTSTPEEYLSNVQQQSDAGNQQLGNCNQELVDGHRKQPARVHSKNRRNIVLSGPTDRDDCHGAPNLKTSSESKHVSSEAVGSLTDSSQKHQSSQILLSSTVSKVTTDSNVDDPMADVMPKKVAAYMTKPGKIVYSTAQRHSTSTETAATKSRSKSRSILPLQSKPRSKQLLLNANLPVDSPSSTFSFDGTPKEDTVCRPAAMLAARKKFISMDDSMLVSEPAEKPPVMRQRSLSSDDITSSPHGIMLVLHNGKRTKPRTARSKSVRYGSSETVSTPPPSAQHRKLDVPLTPYAGASGHPSSTDTDLGNAAAGIVPESPVFISASPVQQKDAEDVSHSAVTIATGHSGNEGQTAVQEKANMNKVLLFILFCIYTIL